jgi:uncharacterized protein (UPF0548 family)
MSSSFVFRLRRPTVRRIDAFLAEQRAARLSYAEVGATRGGSTPRGYVVDRNRVQLGVGEETFHRATRALATWRMADLGWASVHPPAAPIEIGQTVAVVVRHYGFWSMNACRMVYLIDDDESDVRRSGFAYGTLPAHCAIGEERFAIEWLREDDSVWYDVRAFSRPGHLLARLGYPLGRRLQRRFARESKQAMLAAVRPTEP